MFNKMTLSSFEVQVTSSPQPQTMTEEVIMVKISLSVEPQFIIGQNGQTLFELQRILRIMANKQLQKNFYIDLDINDYKSKKIEHLKNIAKELAEYVVTSGEKKVLPPMAAYERRVIHQELSQRKDIISESEGEGENRYIIISPAK